MEMDLILGASGSEAILTLTDRKTDYIFLEALPHGRKAKPITIEHANALIWQYLPKHSSFDGLTKGDLKEIEWRLNNRPRKKLGTVRLTKYFI